MMMFREQQEVEEQVKRLKPVLTRSQRNDCYISCFPPKF